MTDDHRAAEKLILAAIKTVSLPTALVASIRVAAGCAKTMSTKMGIPIAELRKHALAMFDEVTGGES